MLGEIVRGVIEGAVGAIREGRRSRAPQAQLSPTNNYYFVDTHGAITPDQVLGPSWLSVDDMVPSTLHVQFVASEDDEDYFDVDQPAMVLVFDMQDDDEVTVGMRLGEELAIDVAPGVYGVLSVAYMDDDLDMVDGIGFTAVSIDEWGYDVYSAVELYEVDEEEADDFLRELDAELAGAFSA